MTKVETLWSRLEDMEDQKRFSGKAYPEGMTACPFRLQGQGFFPGGDGLWRSDEQLAKPSDGVLPVGGIMFIGNDFGTLKSYCKLKQKGFEKPPTWDRLKRRIQRAELPHRQAFFTNTIMGLRTSGSALDKREWVQEPLFLDFCREFFLYQVQIVKPQLIVVLGPKAQASIEGFLSMQPGRNANLSTVNVGEHRAALLYCTHPYGDFNFSDERKAQDGSVLRQSWQAVQGRKVLP